ncbi:DNA-3-methyladenine glycosylase 2 family protein [Photobacterium alginatilyticum]|uniref:DNA-3-methyladenine glycosylase II n=1 Tax=Photobacterium alginatilyticum TaxID=1775171 RepID=A0ABW9YJ99_9GAMM|nr:AlkA N-terminal domain-containing protein [Photobacterium alginatilyticum]NBI53858.1 DNA-3-methyladenine glycosylase 2 family protein [Photobacterium alginatilyticum]
MDMTPLQCQQARLARDTRYDGLFFTAVKTTGIYCRSICPAPAPKEKNVEYFPTAVAAANAGYRPCLRCRPDSAPGSPAWLGKNATLNRALRLIDEGALAEQPLTHLADRLGITERYLRQLFVEQVGLSPKSYSLYQQCLLAKKLLHDTRMPVTDVALACGFNSIRRFNDCFKQQFSLTPSQIRKQQKSTLEAGKGICLSLAYRPPYNWNYLHQFYASRLIPGLEWLDEKSYGRTFQYDDCTGRFTATHDEGKSVFHVEIHLSDLKYLPRVIKTIRRCLDLDADSLLIEQQLLQAMDCEQLEMTGVRLPGIWSPFEAGIRAILGQQVSVKAARNLVSRFVDFSPRNDGDYRYFPEPAQVSQFDLEQLGMPQRRRDTLRNFSVFAENNPLDDAKSLLALPGIGPWTVDYMRMRGLSEPDIYLVSDLGIKKALAVLPNLIDDSLAAPWRSYLTLYLWSTLS